MPVIAEVARDRKVTFACGRHQVMLTLTELAKVECGDYPKPTLAEIKAKRDAIPKGTYEFSTAARCPICWGSNVFLFGDDEVRRAMITQIVRECAQRDGETSIDPMRKARLELAKDFLKYGETSLDVDSFLPSLRENLVIAGVDFDEATQYLNQMWVEFAILVGY